MAIKSHLMKHRLQILWIQTQIAILITCIILMLGGAVSNLVLLFLKLF